LRVIPGFIILTMAVIEFYYLALMSRATRVGVEAVRDNKEGKMR
jgi:hypothetical protein